MQPKDRDVVCHASAWDIDDDDYRIKMCIEVNGEDFVTIHHELGHNFYQRAYRRKQPLLFRNSANDGFHEAIGDAIALSVTPQYLVQGRPARQGPGTGGRHPVPPAQWPSTRSRSCPSACSSTSGDGRSSPARSRPPTTTRRGGSCAASTRASPPRSRAARNGSIPARSTTCRPTCPTTRYFLARILQFQFHRALCREAGYTGPLHQCSIYGNKAAGAKLNAMLEMGQSRPWPEALEAMTGEKQIDATAILDYFKPLMAWLEKENKGRQGGLEVAPWSLGAGAARRRPGRAAPARPFPPTRAKDCDSCAEWNAPREPFRVFGNTYYVGSRRARPRS